MGSEPLISPSAFFCTSPPFPSPPPVPCGEPVCRGYSFLHARLEHGITQLYSWGACRTMYGTLPDHIQKLHLMVRAIVHIQQLLNVRYEPYGPWDHFSSGIYGQPKATRHRGLDSCGALGSSV